MDRLLFTKIDNKINEVMNFRRPFRFDGETTDGLKISAEQCAAFFTEIKQNGSLPVPLIISRIHTNVLKVYNPNKLENLEEGTDLCIEIGLLNYYSTATNFLINTEIGDIRSLNRLSNDDIAIFKNLHISYNTSVLRLKVKGEKNIEATKAKIFKVVDKILELTSFAVCTQLRWSYLSIFLNEFSDSIADFLSKSYINYTDQLITKYNFAIALKWYLDSMGLRYEVIRFISASTSLESMAQGYPCRYRFLKWVPLF